MLFNDQGLTRPPAILAISQPAHALISGRILAAWGEPLHEQFILAAEQHDIAWIDWEVAPTFDPSTGRPHAFRDVGAAVHAPMWEKGVDRACAAWGRRVALMVSRHGSTIYQRFSDRHRSASDDGKAGDERAANDYLRRQRLLQEGWVRALGLDADAVARETELLAFADSLSLVLCGAVPAPARLEVAGQPFELKPLPDADTYSLSPWPLASNEIVFETEARALPPSGRLPDEIAMHAWLADPARSIARSRLCAA